MGFAELLLTLLSTIGFGTLRFSEVDRKQFRRQLRITEQSRQITVIVVFLIFYSRYSID